jgi:hypothetical protein
MAEVASIMTVTNIQIQYQQRISVTDCWLQGKQRVGCSLGFHGGVYDDGGWRARPLS